MTITTRPGRSLRPARARRVAGLGVMSALLLAACGGGSQQDDTATPTPDATTTTATLAPAPDAAGTSSRPEASTTTAAPPADSAATTTTRAPAADADDESGDGGTASPSAEATGDSTTGAQAADVSVDTGGLPDAVGGVVGDWYTGGDVEASGPAAEVLPDREPADLQGASWSGSAPWRTERLGVVTAGDDVTLLVQSDGEPWRVVGGWWPSMGLDDPVLGGPRHVLIIGSDARVDAGEEVESSRADAIQVLGVDGEGGGGVLGIARDAWVPIPAGFESKINAAMVHGGPQAQVQAVSDVTGLEIDGYVLSGFRGMMSFVNDLGGLQMDVERQVRDIQPGEQVLDGYDAFWFGRERYSVPGGDFGRSANQGLVLAALGMQTRADGPGSLPEVLELVDLWFESDLDAEQMLTFAAWTYRADPAAFGMSVAKGGFGTSSDGQSIVVLDDAAYADFEDFADGNLSSE